MVGVRVKHPSSWVSAACTGRSQRSQHIPCTGISILDIFNRPSVSMACLGYV